MIRFNRKANQALLLIFVSISLYGCGDGPRSISDEDKKRDPIDVALASPAADQRRNGVERLSNSPNGRADWAVEIYNTMARQDVDSMVRCAALTALAKHDPTIAVTLTTDIFRTPVTANVRAVSETAIRPAGVTLRRHAARILFQHAKSGGAADSPKIADAICAHLSQETDHQTRVVLLDTLGHFQKRTVVTTLIDALRVDDFAERRAAEGALVRLTGHTHEYDPSAWESWLAKTNDPFANAGNSPAGWNNSAESDKKWWSLGD